MGSLSGLVAQVRSMFWKQRSGTKNWFLDTLQHTSEFCSWYLSSAAFWNAVKMFLTFQTEKISQYPSLRLPEYAALGRYPWYLWGDCAVIDHGCTVVQSSAVGAATASPNTFMKMLKRKSASFQMARFLFLSSEDMDMDMSSLVRDGAPTLFVSRTDSVKRESGALSNPRWSDQPIW